MGETPDERKRGQLETEADAFGDDRSILLNRCPSVSPDACLGHVHISQVAYGDIALRFQEKRAYSRTKNDRTLSERWSSSNSSRHGSQKVVCLKPMLSSARNKGDHLSKNVIGQVSALGTCRLTSADLCFLCPL